MSLTSLLVPSFTHMLTNLSQWLDKAVAHESAAGNDVDEGFIDRFCAGVSSRFSFSAASCLGDRHPALERIDAAAADARSES